MRERNNNIVQSQPTQDESSLNDHTENDDDEHTANSLSSSPSSAAFTRSTPLRLTVLRLNGCGLTLDMMHALASYVRVARTLSVLSLARNNLGQNREGDECVLAGVCEGGD